MAGYHRFLVARLGDAAANEYRIIDGHVQFRVRDTAHQAKQRWRFLSPNDLQVHLALNTHVGKWITDRLRSLPPL